MCNTEFTLIGLTKKPTRAFTLIELLIVISIIGILAALGVVAYAGSHGTARDAKRQADLQEIRSGLELYRADCGSYPTSLNFGNSLDGPTGSSCDGNTYITSIPLDPRNGTYQYVYGTTTSGYYLCAKLERSSESVNNCSSANCGSGTTTVACNYEVTNP